MLIDRHRLSITVEVGEHLRWTRLRGRRAVSAAGEKAQGHASGEDQSGNPCNEHALDGSGRSAPWRPNPRVQALLQTITDAGIPGPPCGRFRAHIGFVAPATVCTLAQPFCGFTAYVSIQTDCGAPLVCPACGEPAAPGNRACGRALAGIAPARLGIC